MQRPGWPALARDSVRGQPGMGEAQGEEYPAPGAGRQGQRGRAKGGRRQN